MGAYGMDLHIRDTLHTFVKNSGAMDINHTQDIGAVCTHFYSILFIYICCLFVCLFRDSREFNMSDSRRSSEIPFPDTIQCRM